MWALWVLPAQPVDVGEAAIMVHDVLQDNGEESLAVDEYLGSLGHTKDEDVGTTYGPHAVGKTYAVEASDHLLQVDKTDSSVGQDILDDQAHLLAGLAGQGLAHTKLIADILVTPRSDQLHDGDGHLLLQSEAWLHADVLVHNVGGQLGNVVHEGGLAHAGGLKPLFIIPTAQDDLLPSVGTGGMGPELALDGLKVVPEHLSVHDVLGGLVPIGHVKVRRPV
ncbi:hypothetical protein Y1Q_0010114 [Alligator mississippiensis]|uniref:Uncharacterized protein n=1 Tax=Alligator mississippiensis TaxID=8496 RepID=A0A151MG91_ALLMI|nr:hypothetical protein Y1Q_0010114 [Alligator mississippiensis]